MQNYFVVRNSFEAPDNAKGNTQHGFITGIRIEDAILCAEIVMDYQLGLRLDLLGLYLPHLRQSRLRWLTLPCDIATHGEAMACDHYEKRAMSESASPVRDGILRIGGKQITDA